MKLESHHIQIVIEILAAIDIAFTINRYCLWIDLFNPSKDKSHKEPNQYFIIIFSGKIDLGPSSLINQYFSRRIVDQNLQLKRVRVLAPQDFLIYIYYLNTTDSGDFQLGTYLKNTLGYWIS